MLKNNIEFSYGSGDFKTRWYRVLGTSTYALETPGEIPTDRFVGTGVNIFFVNSSYNKAENVHIARFWAWLK